MLPEFTTSLLKSSLKHFFDIDPLILDSLIAQGTHRFIAVRELLLAECAGAVAKIEAIPHAFQGLAAAASGTFRMTTHA
jgi:hypothetical protein